MIERIKTLPSDESVLMYIILAGTNDLGSIFLNIFLLAFDSMKRIKVSLQAEQIFSNLKQMQTFVVNEKKFKCCFISLPELGIERMKQGKEIKEKRENLNDLVSKFCLENSENTRFVDITKTLPMNSLSLEERKKIWCDEIHFTPLGYDTLAEEVFKVISDWI